MALKSGLLCESTWALNVLSVLLYDDTTVVYFGLQHLPGLLEVLLDHLRRCLISIFGEQFEEYEVGCNDRKAHLKQAEQERLHHHKSSAATDHPDEEQCEQCMSSPPSPASDISEDSDPMDNMHLRGFHKKRVCLEKNSEESDVMSDTKLWDIHRAFDSCSLDWQIGRGDISVHILTHFEDTQSQSFHRRSFMRTHRPHHSELLKDTAEMEEASNIPTMYEEDCKVKQEPNISNCACNDSLDKIEGNSLERQHVTSDTIMPKIDSLKDCSNPETPVSHTEVLEQKKNNSGPDFSDDNAQSPKSPLITNIKCEPMEVEIDLSCVKKEVCETDEPADSKGDTSSSSACSNEKNMLPFDFAPAQAELSEMEKLKRKWDECEEETEAYEVDQYPLMLIGEADEEVAKRCVCISNIIRSLSFIPGNEAEMSRHRGLMLVLGKLLMVHHIHPARQRETRCFDKEMDLDGEESSIDGDENCHEEWWWDTLHILREDTLVIFANICGQLNLCQFAQEVCLPILDGLLHWAVCPASYAQDPLPNMSANSVLSPKRLVLEALCKLCVLETNVDLLIATPPFSRVVSLFRVLVTLLGDRQEQVMREFSISLMSSMVQGEESAARAVALQHPCISLLIDFVEVAEQQAMQIASTHGVNMLKENPEMMGTSLDMLRRAAKILQCLARVPDNKSLFMPHQQRLLNLVMSQILDQHVASLIADILFHCSANL